jgi:hypothetical protein
MKKKLIALSSMGMALPFLAAAQTSNACPTLGTVQGILCKIGEILNAIIPVLIALGIVYFVWGVVTYVIASDEEAKSAGRNRIIFGIIGLVVIVGMWGLVGIVTKTFNLNGGAQINYPCVPLPGQSTC